MKKLICLLLCTLLLLSLFLSCDSEKEAPETTEETVAQTQAQTQKETSGDPSHEHVYDLWEKNTDTHRQVCACGEGLEQQPHTFVDGICMVCKKSTLNSEGLDINVDESIGGCFVIGRGSCTEQDLVIPETFNGYPVVAVAYGAFQNDTMTSITFPATLQSIGGYAFEGCSNLTAISLPEGTERIEQGAFLQCTSLKNVTLPTTLTTLSGHAFQSCTMLEEITLPANLRAIDQSTFDGCTSLKKVILPAGMTVIGETAFYGCSSLAEIIFGGTQAQWNGMEKRQEWDYGLPSYTVNCLG